MKFIKNKRLDGSLFHLRLTKQMEIDIDSYCREHGIESKSELIRQAVNDKIYKNINDETLKLQGLMKVNEKLSDLNNFLIFIFKYIREMHVNTLAYHPEIDTEMKNAAIASAKLREDRFFNFFLDNLHTDPAYFENLLARFYSGDSNG